MMSEDGGGKNGREEWPGRKGAGGLLREKWFRGRGGRNEGGERKKG
jgi:hypothetical protein